MLKTCLKRKYIKNSNFIQAMKNSACPKPKFKRRPKIHTSVLGQIRLSDKFGLRINFGFGHALFFIA